MDETDRLVLELHRSTRWEEHAFPSPCGCAPEVDALHYGHVVLIMRCQVCGREFFLEDVDEVYRAWVAAE